MFKAITLSLSQFTLAAVLVSLPAEAQTLFTEDFENLGPFVGGQEGPAALEQLGWIFRVQSGVVLSPTQFDYGWREGPYNLITGGFFTFDAQGGNGCLATDHTSSAFSLGSVQGSNWAILPPITGQAQGDVLTFWSRQQDTSTSHQILEVRYSPSGGTSTGATVIDVGDFSDLLLSVAPPTGNAWGFNSVAIPGSGRLAIRYNLPTWAGGNAQVVGIDTLSVGSPSGPCPDYPTVPAPGQTVHWTVAESPHRICAQTVIPIGSTVIVDPGAEVFVEGGSVLEVYGDLQVEAGARVDTPFQGSVLVYGTASFTGSQQEAVRLTGGPRSVIASAPERIAAMPGARITLEAAELETTVSALGTGVVVANNVAAIGSGNGFYVSGESFSYGGTLCVRSSNFTAGAQIYSLGAYVLLENCLFDDATFRPGRPWAGQTMYIGDTVAVNRPNDSVFHLYGSNFFFDSSNTIFGSRYPVILEGAGIVSGSVLPATGNTFNRVHSLASAEGLAHFGTTGIPYEIDGNTSLTSVGGKIVVAPGVTLQMGPNAGLGANLGSPYGSPLELEGLPGAPIVIEALNPLQPWDTILFGSNGNRPRVEHTIFSGASFALSAEMSVLRVESCTFEDNNVGLDSYFFARIEAHGCRFFRNLVGARSSDSGPTGSGRLRLDANGYPNWFEENQIGLQTRNTEFLYDDARNNYWGASTGPASGTNPGGLGDPVTGTNNVVPFRRVLPLANLAPVVRLEEHSRLLEEGQKLILHWTASDDDRIRSFRILHSPHGELPGLSLVASGIPGKARSWEIVIPPAPPASNYPDLSGLRVEAIDSFGQIGYDDLVFRTPALEGYTGGFQPDPLPGVHRPGELISPCGQWYGNANTGSGYDLFVWFDGDNQIYPMGGGSGGNCFGFAQELPPFSTDLARIVAIHTGGSGGRYVYGFSDYFEVRPDPMIGDAPPQMGLTSPSNGNLYQGGGAVPIAWTASDDEALRSFDIHASYDDGRTWHTVASDLPPGTRFYTWWLPPSSGISDVRVRVIARDLRFQNTSSTSDRFSILPGGNLPTPGLPFVSRQ